MGRNNQSSATPLRAQASKRARSPTDTSPPGFPKRPALRATPPQPKNGLASNPNSPLYTFFGSNNSNNFASSSPAPTFSLSSPSNNTKSTNQPQPSTSKSPSQIPIPTSSFFTKITQPTAQNTRNSRRYTNSKLYKFRHIAPNDNKRNYQWCLPKITKKTLLWFSSNISRINLDPHPDMQVECYPGAKFSHFRTMANKYKDSSHPETIVLNIGINQKNVDQNESEKQLRNMMSSIRKKIPSSKIHFIELNYSDTLSAKEKDCLNHINSIVKAMRDIQIIPAVPQKHFQVETDLIHWTEKTANSLYNHWLSFLN